LAKEGERINPIPCGPIYLMTIEKVALAIYLMAVSTPFVLTILIGPAWISLIFLIIISIYPWLIVKRGMKRAFFINRGGFYRIAHDTVEVVQSNEISKHYSVKFLKAKTKHRNGDRVDVYFGLNISDALKYIFEKQADGIGLFSLTSEDAKKAIGILRPS
jgi:hypothetical protein